MELKTKVCIPVKKEDREYHFDMPYGCPLGEAYDVVHEVLQKIVELSRDAADKTKREEDKK